MQMEGWGKPGQPLGFTPLPQSSPVPSTALFVEGAGALQMGKLRLRVPLLGNRRMGLKPGVLGPCTGKQRRRIALETEKTRGLQNVQLNGFYYCKAHKLPWINSKEDRTSSRWSLSLASPPPAPPPSGQIRPQSRPGHPLLPSLAVPPLLLTVSPVSSLSLAYPFSSLLYHLISLVSCLAKLFRSR